MAAKSKAISDKRTIEFGNAIIHDDLIKVKKLINEGVNINSKIPSYNNFPLLIAIEMGHNDIVKSLLERPNINISVKDNDTLNALHIATFKNNIEIAKLLLIKGIDVNEVTSNNETALHLAAYYGNLKMVELLIEYGANPSIKNNEGQIAKDIARDSISESDEGDIYEQIAAYIDQHDLPDIKEPDEGYETPY